MPEFAVDCSYLQEDNAFEQNQLLPNWPAASNPFLARAARSSAVGSRVELGLTSFVAYIGQVALDLPVGAAVTFDVDLRPGNSEPIAQAFQTSLLSNVSEPIEADNPGFLHYALSWFCIKRPHIRLYVMQGIFWVEAEDS